MYFESAFHEIAAVLVVAGTVAFAGRILHQPLIVSFIAAGILVGPSGMNILRSVEHFDLLAGFGVALLLFVVGLRLDLHLIRTTGGVALTTGLGQVGFTSLVGFGLCLALGIPLLPALYVAVALTFSSTIIIVKLLSDKGEIDALHGRVALGFLIVQDIVVVVAMITLSTIGIGATADGAGLPAILLGGILLVVATAVFARHIAHRVLNLLAGSQELMVFMAICLAVALAALGDWIGLGKELGAFLGGVALASTPYREVIGSRLSGLRDFLLVFFFIGMALHVDLSTIDQQVLPALVLSAFVLVGNPLIVMVIMGAMGYRSRTGFLAGLTVAQISEFSLIFADLGLRLGHLDQETVGLITLVGLITIGSSTYMILYSHMLHRWLSPWLGAFERSIPYREQREAGGASDAPIDIVVLGLGRYGRNIARGLAGTGHTVLGVDFDPEVVRSWCRGGGMAVYGDAMDANLLATLPLNDACWVVSTIPTRATGVTESDPATEVPRSLRLHGFRGRIAVVTHRPALEREGIVESGADLVLIPYADAAERAVEEITGWDRMA